MLKTLRRLVTRLLLLVAILPASLHLAAFESEFLTVEEAFQVQVHAVDGQIVARWDIAPGYHLDQEKISLAAVDAHLSLAPAVFATPGEIKDDPTFGVQPVYHNSAPLTADIISAPGG